MKFSLLIFVALFFVAVIAVPVSAASGYMVYGGVILPVICDESYRPYSFIYEGSADGTIYFVNFQKLGSVYSSRFEFSQGTTYKLVGDTWEISAEHGNDRSFELSSMVNGAPIWCNFDGINGLFVSSLPTEPLCDGSSCPSTDANKDNICDDCGFEFAVLRDYSPFTVKKFMNNIGQIFTSAISWVGNVGSTILQQPLLLAFCALPICGIGIGVYRRLRGID